MENYYEYLEIDMTATDDEISSAVETKSSQSSVDQVKIREVKSILLNDAAKKIYDEKLINLSSIKEKCPVQLISATQRTY